MNPARMQARGLGFISAQAAYLPGYQLRFNKQSYARPEVAYANIEPCTSGQVEGVLYQLASAEAMVLMDGFEGTPVRYSRECLAVELKTGVQQAAWVYLANPAFINNNLLPESSYLAHLLAGEAFLSREYLLQLRQQPSVVTAVIPGEAGLKFNV